jgi:prephenate dehydrogenase
MTIAIVGIGLIGGSLALDLRKRNFAGSIYGVDTSIQHQNIAKLCGIVDDNLSLDEAIERSDMILLCTPVDTNCRILPDILDRITGTSKVVADMGSTKRSIAETAEYHPARGRFVAAHPMAGTEYSGPLAAIGKLFDYKPVIICDPELSDKDALEHIEEMFRVLNMQITYMNSAVHDVHVAYVSHISHITSFSLALSVLEKEHFEDNILTLAGGGFDSTVRLAKSNAETWGPIFTENAFFILEAIDTYIEKMNLFRKYIAEKNTEGLKSLMEEANKIRKILH